MKELLLIVLVAILLPVAASANEIGFRDLIIGMDKTAMVANSKEKLVECRGNVCEYESEIKATSVKVLCYINNDKLYFIKIEFDPSNYQEIKGAMKEKWGNPEKVSHEKATNLFGVSVVSENLSWKIPSGLVTLKQFDSMTKGRALIAGHDFVVKENSGKGF